MVGQGRQVDFCAEQVLEQYADMVYRLAIIHMKNKADAEDVFQEVFLRLVKNADKISSEEHLKAWLIKVTVNCCKKQFDSAWNRHRASLEYDVEESYEMEEKDKVLRQRCRNCRKIIGRLSICSTMKNTPSKKSAQFLNSRRQR